MQRALVPIDRPAASPELRQRSSVATLAAAGQIGADEVMAAWEFARLWREMSDGRSFWDLMIGTGPAPSTPKALAAKQQLQAIRNEVGGRGFELCCLVAVEGYSLSDLFVSRRMRDTHSDMLRLHLAEIALLLHRAPSK